eukprot:TRINITY_DN4135_c1_g1_i1.p1 TRINITY_DN4135_c1_g1~~TRINITY_DN4135_c1_g1_i1.p1  ORF type:complete len:284 (-),score=86.52 TRINITY_DN4135_c1_g1_i1:136-987(-)
MTDGIVQLFKENDTNGDGTIDLAELTSVMTEIGFPEEECQRLFEEADLNKDGCINYEEFLTWIYVEKPAENAGEGEGPAPFLTKAFGVMTASILEMQTAAMEGGEEADMAAIMSKQEEAKVEFVSLLEQSFDHHNTEGTGVLSPEEAQIFFSNLVAESGGFMQNIAITCMRTMSMTMLTQVIAQMDEASAGDDNMTPEAKAAVKMQVISGMKEGMQAEIGQLKASIELQIADYKANKEERDAAAFKVLDSSGNGTIEKEEFKEAFTPETEKNNQLMEALGLPR